MKTIKVSQIFDVHYGVNLELNKLEKSVNGINFVSRTAKNNGVSAKVKALDGITPNPKNTISVAGGGSVMESFLQSEPFYSGRDLYYLVPKQEFTSQELLYYCACLRANKFRFNYGRQANRTLKDLLLPSPLNIPKWVNSIDPKQYNGVEEAHRARKTTFKNTNSWKYFMYKDLFEIERGKGPRKKDLSGEGETPFVTSSDHNNGWTDYTSHEPIHQSNTIGVNRNGSVAEAFYQPIPFCSTEDVHIFKPKFKLNPYIAMFLSTLIRLEKYRYNYGRKWGIARMYNSKIKLPVTKKGEPDWKYMEQFIKSLPFSKNI